MAERRIQRMPFANTVPPDERVVRSHRSVTACDTQRTETSNVTINAVSRAGIGLLKPARAPRYRIRKCALLVPNNFAPSSDSGIAAQLTLISGFPSPSAELVNSLALPVVPGVGQIIWPWGA